MSKPVYEREVWKVMKQIADQLKLAQSHCPVKEDYQCKRHIASAEVIATKFIVEDMEKAKQCQRKEG